MKRILGKVEGVSSVQTDVAKQSVVVTGTDAVRGTDLVDALGKWAAASGKQVSLA